MNYQTPWNNVNCHSFHSHANNNGVSSPLRSKIICRSLILQVSTDGHHPSKSINISCLPILTSYYQLSLWYHCTNINRCPVFTNCYNSSSLPCQSNTSGHSRLGKSTSAAISIHIPTPAVSFAFSHDYQSPSMPPHTKISCLLLLQRLISVVSLAPKHRYQLINILHLNAYSLVLSSGYRPLVH